MQLTKAMATSQKYHLPAMNSLLLAVKLLRKKIFGNRLAEMSFSNT